ncbi:MAG: hypothetical protein QW244_01285 [Candidatus Pacearchaeota archaeon]
MEKLIALFLILLSIIYAKFFLQHECKEEVKNFKKLLKKVKISLPLFNIIILFLFLLSNLLFLLVIKKIFLLPFLFIIFLAIVAELAKNNARYIFLLYELIIIFLSEYLLFLSLLFIIFNLIYLSLN